MRAKFLGPLLAAAVPVLSLFAQQPAPPAAPPPARGQAPQPGGRGQAPPRYELTTQDRDVIGAKLSELDALVRALKAKRGEDDLMADIEIHAKAGHWFLEFPQDVTVQEDVANAIKVLDRGIARAKQLQGGQSPWTKDKGRGSFGMYSPLDGSVQPFLLTIPETYDGTRPLRLDVWLHGRAQRLIETNYICADPSPTNLQAGPRLYTHAAGSCMAPNPQPTATGVANVGQFQLEVFARGNNANHWAGEVDVFESIAAVQRRFKIDPSRVFLRGFSLGGAGAWHLALHYPDRWAAAEIGAGTWPRRYLMMDTFAPHQRPTLRIWENMTEWALNAFNLPLAAHDGDSDTQVASIPPPPQGSVTRGQLESSIRIREQLAKEGYASEGEPNDLAAKGTSAIFLISENTGHSTSSKVRARLDGFLKEWTEKGLQSPDHIRFLTYTTRYNKSFWVSIDGLAKHYERADVDAQRNPARTSYQIKTNNVTRLVLRDTDKAAEIQIDGQTLRVKPARELALDKSAAGWSVAASTKWAGLHKTHALQGPIDDAFLDPFLLVRPTGTPWNATANELALKRLTRFDRAYALNYRAHPRVKNDTEVTDADFAKYNVVLFGDPGSNRWIARLAGKTPLQWTRERVSLGKRTFASTDHLPVMVYPNPLAPSRYVVLNSGLTIAENSYRSDYSMPTLGDVAVLQTKAGVEEPEVAFAGFFDESWKLPEDSGPVTGLAPFVPQPILQGGEVFQLFPPGSPYLNASRVREPEQNNMARGVPGRIQSIVNIHNPSIELHRVDAGINTGTAVILVAGGGHNTLNVGTEGADFVPYFYNYGVSTIILRSRLRRDGYNPLTDEVYDAQQAIRMVRAHSKEWGIDPSRIGIMGFSAGAELAAPAAVFADRFDAANKSTGDPLAGISSRPDFVVLIYPGPTPFARDANTPVPKNTPPVFIATAGTGDAVHANWALEYFSAMLKARIPNVEMHVYGNGIHANGLKDRQGTPFGTWQNRFIDWARDLGFLDKPGMQTKAARDVEAHVAEPPPPARGQGGRGATSAIR